MRAMMGLAEQFGAEALIGVFVTFWFWLKGFFALAVVGSIFWSLTKGVKEPKSFKALLDYLIPKGYYSHPTMKPAYWNLAFWILALGPLLSLIGGAKLGESFAVLLTHRFGSRVSLFQSEWPTATIQLTVMFWGTSFFVYWLHYAFHKVPLLWSIHRVHHSSETLGITALLHTHPLEDLVFGPLMVLPTAGVSGLMLYAMGAREFHPTVLAILAFYGSWEVFHGIFEHSHVRISLGWFNRIYAGAVLHQIHHSAELRHRDKNLGLHFAATWDWVFGTLYIPDKDEQYRWGLNDEEYGENNPHLTVRDFYLEPFIHASRVLAGWHKPEHPNAASATAIPVRSGSAV